MIIGCIRPAETCYAENLTTLDFLNRLDVLSDPNALPKICLDASEGIMYCTVVWHGMYGKS